MTARKKKRRAGGAAVLISIVLVLLLAALLLFWTRVWQPKKMRLIYPLLYREELLAASAEFEIDPCMLAALVYCESSYQADAVSHVGAIGLMQIMPETGQWLSGKIDLESEYATERLYEPEVNLPCRYFWARSPAAATICLCDLGKVSPLTFYPHFLIFRG